MRFKIEVKACDIKKGEAGWTLSCPIALATKRATKTAFRVYSEDIRDATGSHIIAALPAKASKFVLAFDGGRKVKPFSFVINIPNRELAK